MKKSLRALKSFQGLTLIELLITISIIAIIGAAATPFVGSFILRNNYQTTTNKVVSVIRKAQGYAMDHKDGGTWGVCVTGILLRLFNGTCASPVFSEDFTIPNTVTITGMSSTTFSLRGEPNPANGLASVSISSSNGSKTVIVNAGGGISQN